MRKILVGAVSVAGSLAVCGTIIGCCMFLNRKTNNSTPEGVNSPIELITRNGNTEPYENAALEDPKLFHKMVKRADAVLGNIPDAEREAISTYVYSSNIIVKFMKN